ncbi:hypothetical protein DSECCO2_524130 [anaerobic digester metagenome]
MTVYPPSGGGYDTANSSLQHPLQVMPAQCLFTTVYSRMIYPIRAGATLPVLLAGERVYDFKCADPGKITPVPGDERALMREGSGGNDRIGEFHPARSAIVSVRGYTSAERMKSRASAYPSGVCFFQPRNSIFVMIEIRNEEVSISSISPTLSGGMASARY